MAVAIGFKKHPGYWIDDQAIIKIPRLANDSCPIANLCAYYNSVFRLELFAGMKMYLQ